MKITIYENTVLILELLNGVKQYIKKNPVGSASTAISTATGLAMMKHATAIAAAKAAGKSGTEALKSVANSTGGISGALLKAKEMTTIGGSQKVTDSIVSGVGKAVNAVSSGLGGKALIDIGSISTLGISWLPMAAGLTAYGISRLVKYYKSLKYKELKLKKMQQILPKVIATKNINKITSFKEKIKNLQIDINAERKILNQQKYESQKEIQAAQNSNIKNKNPEKTKNIIKSRQILAKVH